MELEQGRLAPLLVIKAFFNSVVVLSVFKQYFQHRINKNKGVHLSEHPFMLVREEGLCAE